MTGLNRPAIIGVSARKGASVVAGDSEAKKKWDKENMVFVAFKLFRKINEKQNDQDIIDFLQDKTKGEVIKAALREYMKNHKEEET